MKESRVVRIALVVMMAFVIFAFGAAGSVYAANNNGVDPSTDYARIIWLFIGLGIVATLLFVYYGTRTRMIQQASNWVFAKLSGYYRYDRELYTWYSH